MINMCTLHWTAGFDVDFRGDADELTRNRH